jgi:chromatin segregation and condensation protein Rec8/ScpA/Scc1 (kleisin family)
VRFSELFEQAANRWEVICTFLALLELIRLKQLACNQPEAFSEIEISRSQVNLPAETPVSAAESAATPETSPVLSGDPGEPAVAAVPLPES